MKDFLAKLKLGCDTVYCNVNISNNKPVILCVVPNLSVNGAQTAFIELLGLLTNIKNYQYCIISPEDGVCRGFFVDAGCIVCIRPNISANEEFRSFLQSSIKAVLLNTVLVHGYSLFFVNTGIPVFWWIHEGIEHIRSCCVDMPNPNLLSSNIHIYGVSPVVNDAFKELYDYHISILPICISDEHEQYVADNTSQHKKIRFFIPAAYSPIKGQDILLSAISELPDDYKQRSLFEFCGYITDDNMTYYKTICKLSNQLHCVNHLGILDKKKMYQHYADCDCVIAPSRIDTNPASIIEGMMFHKLTLASDKTGISQFMTDCVNGFVFHDINDLVKRLLLIISDAESLKPIAERGADIWKKHFSPENVTGILLNSGVF